MSIPTLDLHGIRHTDAKDIVENFVLLYSDETMRVITGNSKQMKSLVVSVLKQHEFKYTHPNDYNLGTFIIYG